MNARRMKRNDLLPELTESFIDGAGNPINLTGATIKFIMTLIGGSTTKINTTATIVDPTTGSVKYSWAGSDTDTAGKYKAEFEATLSGKKMTAPNDGYILIWIIEDLA